MKPFNDTRLRWFGPLVLMLFGTFFFRLEVYLSQPIAEVAGFALIALVSGYLCWNLSRGAILWMQRRYPGLPQTRRRLLRYAILFPILVNAAVFLRVELQALRHGNGLIWPGLLNYASTAGIQIFYHCLYFGLYEGWYVLRAWRQTHLEKEELLKAQWQTKFDSLKNQVNPHFLFNSLNTLSSLVDENPRLAGQFVDELSSVYRYLLRSSEASLTTLASELEFIQSYFHLLKTRHGAGLELRVEVPDLDRETLLPPLTLQLLVENAVKHNLILPDQPLRITIRTEGRGLRDGGLRDGGLRDGGLRDGGLRDGGRLLVQNTLQRKKQRVDSNRVGLTNIGVRYRLLGYPEPLIEESHGLFSVALPLIPANPA
jgi:hypothetical protein